MLQVWWLSLALCAGAFGTLGWLIVARQLRDRRDVARAALQQTLRDALLAHLGGAHEAANKVAAWRGRAVLAAQVLLQYVALIGGAERQALVRVMSDAGLDEAMRRRAGRSSKAGRLSCLEALGCFSDTASLDVLRRATLEADADIRLAGWRALRAAGARVGVLQLLHQPGFNDPSPPLSYCEFLQQVAETDTAGAIAALSVTSLTTAVRQRLVAAVGRTGADRSGSMLLRIASDDEPIIRAEALKALAGRPLPLPVPLLLQAMVADAWEVRAEAVAALVGRESADMLPLAASLLDDASWPVRQKAAEVLSASGDDGLQRLKAAAESGSPRARLAASLALTQRAAA